MSNGNLKWITNFIWGIADDVLRDVVRLMADLLFLPIAGQFESGTYFVYDGACGTDDMLDEILCETAGRP